MNISKAIIADIPELVTLINSAYRGESSKKGWTTEADLLDGLRTDADSLKKLMEQPGNTILKFTDNQHLPGCVFLQKKDDIIYLGMLTVSPPEQEKGLGKKLLLVAEDFARENRCNAIEMTVISIRYELITWYEKRGYHITGERRPFPDDPKFGIPKQPLEFIVMKKML